MADAKNWAKSNIDNAADKAKQGVDRASDAVEGARQGGGTGTVEGLKGHAQSAVNTLTDYAGQAKDKAQDAIHSATDSVGHAAEKVQRWAGDAYGSASEGVGHAADKAQRWAGDAYDMSAEHVKDFGQELTGMVRRYPLPAILVGFGVGLLIGRTSRA